MLSFSRVILHFIIILFGVVFASYIASADSNKTPALMGDSFKSDHSVIYLADCGGSTTDFINGVITGSDKNNEACSDDAGEAIDTGNQNSIVKGITGAGVIDTTVYESKYFPESMIADEWAGIGEFCKTGSIKFAEIVGGYLGKIEMVNRFDGYKTRIILEVGNSRVIKGKSQNGDGKLFDYFVRRFPAKISKKDKDGKTVGMFQQLPVILEMYWSGRLNDFVFFIPGVASGCRYRRTSQMATDYAD